MKKNKRKFNLILTSFRWNIIYFIDCKFLGIGEFKSQITAGLVYILCQPNKHTPTGYYYQSRQNFHKVQEIISAVVSKLSWTSDDC